MRWLRLALLPFLLMALSGCKTQQTVMGHAPAVAALTAIHDMKPSGRPVTIQGTMIDKCPMSGCWFKVQDRSGVVKVDTKSAGFVVVDVPLGTQVTVSGTFQTDPVRQLNAQGLRY